MGQMASNAVSSSVNDHKEQVQVATVTTLDPRRRLEEKLEELRLQRELKEFAFDE